VTVLTHTLQNCKHDGLVCINALTRLLSIGPS